MKLKILFLILALPSLTYSQKLNRNVFVYDKLNTENFVECDENLKKELESSLIAIQENNSSDAVEIAQKIYDVDKGCYQIYEVYGTALFRSGQWFEGIDIIEKGIEKFGSVPELIKGKSEMSIEMAELGTGQKNIDGNSVYKANSLKYDEEQFIEENFKSALIDLEYLMNTYNRSEETFYVGKIQQVLKNYDKSTEVFKTLLKDEEYKYGSIFNIADNYIAQFKYQEAEVELNTLLAENPKDGQVYEKLAELYEQKKDEVNKVECKSKAIYYNNIPTCSDLEYSKDNFELLKFFGTDENKSDIKIKKLDEILKQNTENYTIDVCLMILNLHANHGNGVEEKATTMLSNIGKSAIVKVNLLFQTDVSTCTITNLAEIMAIVKDDASWELMKQYLPNIANMPMTLIPPTLPEKMVKFDEDKGIKEILLVVKQLLSEDKKSDDPMAELNGFGQYVYYSPLENISKKKLKKIATELNYTDQEFELLEAKIK